MHDAGEGNEIVVSFNSQPLDIFCRSVDQPDGHDFEGQKADEEERGHDDEHDDHLTTRLERRLRPRIVGNLGVVRLHDELSADESVHDEENQQRNGEEEHEQEQDVRLLPWKLDVRRADFDVGAVVVTRLLLRRHDDERDGAE